jgi:uncharacterized protein (DUF305 family)
MEPEKGGTSMSRRVVAVVGVLAVLLAVATVAVAAAVVHDRGEGGTSAYGGPSMWRDRDRPLGERGWMHGFAVTTEFGYLTQMVAHHEEAVAAATELQRSDRPQLRELGRSIVASQTAQIDQMTAWLAEWYPGRSTDVNYQPMMRDLTGLFGDRLDRVFLQDMIPHHMMAVMMSQQLLMRGVADHEEVGGLAETIRDEQHAEIFWMQRRLSAWFDTGWGHGMGIGPGTGTGPGVGMGPGMMR